MTIIARKQGRDHDVALRDSGFPKSAARVVPASDLYAFAAVMLEVRRLFLELAGICKDQIEHTLRIGLHIAAIATEERLDRFAVFFLEIFEQDVVAVGEHREEVPLLARLASLLVACNGLNANSRRVVEMQNAV